MIRDLLWENPCPIMGDGTSAWWKESVVKAEGREKEVIGPFDGTGRPYWKEVTRKEFEEEMLSMFSALTSKECSGHWHPIQNRPCRPELRIGDDRLIIHQESAIYDDFKIDWSTGQTRYFLHNFGFAV